MTQTLQLVMDSSRSARLAENTASAARSMSSAPLSVEHCLQLWGAWERGYRTGPQQVRVAIWASPAASHDAKASDMLSKSDKWVAQNTSKAIEALPNRAWKLVLEITYVWNGYGHRVFSNNRLPSDAMVLAGMLEEAKQALVPILERRGLPVTP